MTPEEFETKLKNYCITVTILHLIGIVFPYFELWSLFYQRKLDPKNKLDYSQTNNDVYWNTCWYGLAIFIIALISLLIRIIMCYLLLLTIFFIPLAFCLLGVNTFVFYSITFDIYSNDIYKPQKEIMEPETNV